MSSQANATTIASNRFDVVGFGLNAMDYITVVPQFPTPHTKVPIQEIRLEPGGQVATALVTCTRLGLRARYIGSVGSDELGRLQLESLESAGVDTQSVRVVEGATSQLAFAIVEENVGERTILWHRDSRLTFPPTSLSRDMIASGRLLHLDGRDSKAALQSARWARELGIPVVIDIDKVYDETTKVLLGQVDYLIAAEEFALQFTGQKDPEEAAVRLAADFPQALIGVTLGKQGAVFIIDDRPQRSFAFEVPIRDTTGAGDVFHGAFIFGVLERWRTEKTIRFAHAAAAMKCGKLGARTGIPSLEEIGEFLKTAKEKGP